MSKIFKKSFIRNDKNKLFLFGYEEHNEKPGKQLAITKSSLPHMRWHPIRKEWITYSSSRKNRTSFPPKKYCPLCPGKNLKFPTEIPFKNFEVAVFPNRWSSFNKRGKVAKINKLKTKESKGICEVVVYSSKHTATIAEMTIKEIELLIRVWIDRYISLLKDNDVKYVLIFENRGKECGVTLHHPHGQIYGYPFIPSLINEEIKAFKKNNYIKELIKNTNKNNVLFEDEYFIALVPPYARYAYEIWTMPKKKHAGPWSFSKMEITSFALIINKIVKCYDSFINKRCPYIMGLHAAPKINDKSFHFHVEFYPPLRYKNKPKILAGSESMAGVFIMDVLPEDSAKELKRFF